MENQTLEVRSDVVRNQSARALPMIVSLLAIVGGVALRWTGLGEKSLWFDEGYTAWIVSLPMREIVRMIRVDTAPPLYYLLLHGWTQLFGHSESALRSMSALMASVSLIVFAMIARQVLRSEIGRAAAMTLFSFSFMQIAYGHEARFYAMMTMMGAIDLYLVLLICQRSSLLRLTGLILAWTLTLYTNNIMAIYLACLGAGWLILPGAMRLKARLLDLLLAGVCSAVLFAPWVPTMLAQTKRLRAGFWPAKPDAWMLLRTIGVMTGAHEQSLPHGDGHWFLQVVLLLLALTGLGLASRKHWRITLVVAGFGFMPILLIFVYSHLGTSIFVERAFLASGIAMPLLIVIPLEAVRSTPARVLAITGIVAMLFLSGFSLPGRFKGEQNEGWRDACQYASQLTSHADHALTVCTANEGELMYDYYARQGDYSRSMVLTGTPVDFFELDPPRTLQRVRRDEDVDPLRAILQDRQIDSVALICSHSWWGDGHGRTLALISSRFNEVSERQFDQIRVYWFAGRR